MKEKHNESVRAPRVVGKPLMVFPVAAHGTRGETSKFWIRAILLMQGASMSWPGAQKKNSTELT